VILAFPFTNWGAEFVGGGGMGGHPSLPYGYFFTLLFSLVVTLFCLITFSSIGRPLSRLQLFLLYPFHWWSPSISFIPFSLLYPFSLINEIVFPILPGNSLLPVLLI